MCYRQFAARALRRLYIIMFFIKSPKSFKEFSSAMLFMDVIETTKCIVHLMLYIALQKTEHFKNWDLYTYK